MTAIGYAVVMPLYCAAHLFYGPRARKRSALAIVEDAQLASYSAIYTLPASIIVSYLIPTALMAYPDFTSNAHQLLVASWQFFPLWVTVAQEILGSVENYAFTFSRLKIDADQRQHRT